MHEIWGRWPGPHGGDNPEHEINKNEIINFESIKSIDDLEKVSREVIWQNFERLAAFILEKNGFQVRVNVVKVFNKKRRQYDVIADKGDRTLLVECKKWSGDRYRLSQMKAAVEKHNERTEFYRNEMKGDAIPVIVALIEEDIQFYEGVPIIPISKLNSFINEMDKGDMSLVI